MMWESMSIGTFNSRGCRGRATTVNDANDAVEIQTYRTPIRARWARVMKATSCSRFFAPRWLAIRAC